jgi:hypothetical protein
MGRNQGAEEHAVGSEEQPHYQLFIIHHQVVMAIIMGRCLAHILELSQIN